MQFIFYRRHLCNTPLPDTGKQRMVILWKTSAKKDRQRTTEVKVERSTGAVTGSEGSSERRVAQSVA